MGFGGRAKRGERRIVGFQIKLAGNSSLETRLGIFDVGGF
jgi:hypothetical protein